MSREPIPETTGQTAAAAEQPKSWIRRKTPEILSTLLYAGAVGALIAGAVLTGGGEILLGAMAVAVASLYVVVAPKDYAISRGMKACGRALKRAFGRSNDGEEEVRKVEGAAATAIAGEGVGGEGKDAETPPTTRVGLTTVVTGHTATQLVGGRGRETER